MTTLSSNPMSLPQPSAGSSIVRLFVDTEFTDLLNCELLSIGIVSTDGREFYAEARDVDLKLCSDFSRVAVLPQLGKEPSVVCSEEEMSKRLLDWLAPFKGGSPIIVSVDHPTDWELFTYLVRDPETLRTPEWIRGESIRGAIDPRLIEAYWNRYGRRSHHALHDALANRYAFERRESGSTAG